MSWGKNEEAGKRLVREMEGGEMEERREKEEKGRRRGWEEVWR